MKIQLWLVSVFPNFNYYLSNVLYGFYEAMQRDFLVPSA